MARIDEEPEGMTVNGPPCYPARDATGHSTPNKSKSSSTLRPWLALGPVLLTVLGSSCPDKVGPPNATPTLLFISTQPSPTAQSGVVLAQQPVVQLRDASGSDVGRSGVLVTASLAGGGSLGGTTSVQTNGSGQGVFANLTITGTVGDRSIQFSAPNLSSATSTTIALMPGPPAQLALATPASSTAQSSVALVQQPVVQLRDGAGNNVSQGGVLVTPSIATGGGTLSPTTAVPTNASGQAAFDNLAITGLVGDRTLQFSAPNLAAATSGTITLTPGPAAQLALATPPSSTAQSGVALVQQPVVQLRDGAGNNVSQSGVQITPGIATGGGALSPTAAVPTNTSGQAPFSNLAITGLVGDRTLQFSAVNLTSVTSSTIALTPGPTNQLVITTVPSSTAQSGVALSQQPAVQLRDGAGNNVSQSGVLVTPSIATGGGTLSPTAAVPTNSSGQASFSSLAITGLVGDRTLQFSAPNLAAATSGTITLAPGPAAQLALATLPSSTAQSGVALAQQPVAQLQDGAGNNVSQSGVQVTPSIATGGGTLSPTAAVPTNTSGQAPFNNLAITGLVGDRTLQFSAANLTTVTSGTIALTPGPASRAVLTAQPSAVAISGVPLPQQPEVQLQDGAGNDVNSGGVSITASLASGTGVLSGGTTVQTAAGGLAAFANLAITGSGDHTLRFSGSGLANDTSGVVALPNQLQNGVPATALNGAQGSERYFVVQVPAGASQLTVTTAGGTGDVDLYVESGDLPARSAFDDCSATSITTNEQCSFANPAAGSWFVLLHGFAAYSGVGLTASVTVSGGISGTITATNNLLSPPATTQRLGAAASATVPRLSPPMIGGPFKEGPVAGSPLQPAAMRPQLRLVVPNELIVTYRSAALGTPPAASVAFASRTIAQAANASIRARLTSTLAAAGSGIRIQGVSPALLAARIVVEDPLQIQDVAARLRGDPGVAVVEPNYIAQSDAVSRRLPFTPLLPSDPYYPRQAWHYSMIDLPEAWSITTGASGVLVAVVDDGIRFDHPALAPNLTSDGYDFVSDLNVNNCAGGTISNAGDGGGYDSDPTIPASYQYNSISNCAVVANGVGAHGVHVAGTIGAAGNDGLTVTGVSWVVRIRPVRVLGVTGVGTNYDIAQGILYAAGLPADNGAGGTVQPLTAARVINLSLGGPSSTDLQNAVIAANNAGALIVAAAGNASSSVPNYPASYPEALSVSAVGPDGVLASYSSFGSQVDIAAPGGDIADGGATFGVYSSRWDFATGLPTYDYLNGTSMAAPHVSGVAALLLAAAPSLTVAQLRNRLEGFAVDAGPVGRDDSYGNGILNARNSLTQTLAPARGLFARLYIQSTGALVSTVQTGPSGFYSFAGLADGAYLVYGGEDVAGDGVLGIPGRRWGAAGGSAIPSVITIAGGGAQTVNFSIGFPAELEPNDQATQQFSDALPVGGYMQGTITAGNADHTYVRIPTTGTYTIETHAVQGACNYADQVDTVVELFDASGTLLDSNDDINASALMYCSRITRLLSPGTYFVRVTGYAGTSVGRYRVQARAGP